jgi:hypothetical protein
MENVFWKFIYSRNRGVYIKLALRYRLWPWRVYALAHGRHSKGRREGKTLEALHKQEIISDVKSW